MRRLLALALLVLLGSSLSGPLLAFSGPSDEAVPLCCKTGGKHHCMMRVSHSGSERQMASVSERCPCYPQSMVASAGQMYAAPAGAVFYAQVVSHPASHAQQQAQLRISFDRSRHKRGPPQIRL